MDTRELPIEFLDKMKELLGDSYGEYLDSFHKESFYGLRVNTLKNDPAEFVKSAPFKLNPVRWISNGFYYDGLEKPARHPYYYAGLYYLQEPSAMTPANLLPVEPGDCVLDLCAAPGGKSTELAAKLKGKGMLFSNDISSSRAKALLKNLELAGVENFCAASETPEKLVEYFEGFFDKILVDAPCSGEGMFRRDRDMVKSWVEKGPGYYSAIQRTIVEQAVRLLKPGGMLLYSTCTFDVEEDEGTIGEVLKNHPEMSLIVLKKQDGFKPGIGLTECVRLFPHQIDGEGHFIALLHKADLHGADIHGAHIHGADIQGVDLHGADIHEADIHEENISKIKISNSNLSKAESQAVSDFLKHVSKVFDPVRLYNKNECVYYLPEPLLYGSPDRLLKIRYLRTGLLLGELKKGRFEPSQALAMCLKKSEFSDVIDFSSGDERVMRYLKGETIALSDKEINNKEMSNKKINDIKGWCLVCVDGFPLGWAKRAGSGLKNKYYPGWRWQ